MKNNYYHQEETVAEYLKMAAEVNSSTLIKRYVRHLNENASVLELGTGPGTDWQLLNSYVKTIGSDVSEVFIQHLNATFPGNEFLLLDAITLKTQQKFNGIYANKVLHHLTDEELEMSLKKQADILLPGGVVMHSYWLGEGTEDFKGMFVNYHDKQYLQELYSKQFKVLEMECYQEFERDDSIYIIAQVNNH